MTGRNFYKLFVGYFIVFGIVISIGGASINYYLQIGEQNKSFIKKASEIFKLKNEIILKGYISNIDNIVKSLANNQLIENGLLNKKELEYIFLAVANSNNIIMQIRYIDKNGKELIKVERNKELGKVYLVNESNLQDKNNGDCFKIISNMKKDEIWHSKLDLNIENKKIEVPYKPTFRIGTPIFNKDKLEGIVVVNLLLDDLLKIIGTSTIFEHYIIDKEQNYILHPNDDFSFNKYKNINRDIKLDFPDGLESKEIFTYSLKEILRNEDDAVMIIKPKSDYKKEIFSDKIQTILIVLSLTVLLSVIMALIISKIPRDIQKKLFRANQVLNEFKRIINKYVITVTTKPDGTIIETSDAFEKISEYSKKELLGKSMAIVKHPEQDKKVIKELWNTILNKKNWVGITRNKKKDGNEFWLEQTIIPKIDENDNSIKEFVSISMDITANKELEKIATIDKLTNIYNRRVLDDFFKREIEVASRHNEQLSLIIIDIDYFKKVNDTFGHLSGDNLLMQISKIISSNLRISDIFGRYGGEEFLIICPKTDKESAYILAEKLRILIKEYEFEEIGHKTVSLGIADYQKDDTMQTLFKKADTALYEAKSNGRNNSVIFSK